MPGAARGCAGQARVLYYIKKLGGTAAKGKVENMVYRKLGSTWLMRLDPQEEVVACILQLCKNEGVRLATVSGFGALENLRVGVWDVQQKLFMGNDFEGKYEMVSLVGNITWKDGAPYLHAHMSAGDENGRVVGGHLIQTVVSATAEIMITELEGEDVGRRLDPVTGVVILDM